MVLFKFESYFIVNSLRPWGFHFLIDLNFGRNVILVIPYNINGPGSIVGTRLLPMDWLDSRKKNQDRR